MSAINSTSSVNQLLDPQQANAATKQAAATKVTREQDSVSISGAARAAQGGGDTDGDGDSK